jgi:hypothetical protein
VNPGDFITADLREISPGYWAYSLEDLTTGQSTSNPRPLAYSGSGTSAEWIEEDPGSNAVTLADFGTVSFTGLEVNGVPPTLDAQDNGLDMVQNGKTRAITSTFANNGFTVTYQ